MTFRIRRGDEDLGSASLDELRARRETGELTGSEWVPLEAVLGPAVRSAAPPDAMPPLLSAPARKRRISPILVLVVLLLVLAGMVCFVRPPLQQPATTEAPAARSPGFAAASKPISVKATPTVRDTRKRRREFDIRQWLDAYQERSVHVPSAGAADEEYVRVTIDKDDQGPKEDRPLKLDEDGIRIASDPREAEELYQSWRASMPADSPAHGPLLHALGRFDEAIPYLEKTSTSLYSRLYFQTIWDDVRRGFALSRPDAVARLRGRIQKRPGEPPADARRAPNQRELTG
jgi:hypothetical protein